MSTHWIETNLCPSGDCDREWEVEVLIEDGGLIVWAIDGERTECGFVIECGCGEDITERSVADIATRQLTRDHA